MELKETQSNLSKVWSIVKTQRNAYSGGSIQHLPNEDKLVCLLDENISFLNIQTGVVEGTLLPEGEETNEQIVCFVITKDGTQLFYATRNQLIHQYDLVNKKEVKFWRAHEGPIHTMDIDPSGHYLLTGSADHTAKVWDIDGCYCTHNFKHPFGVVHLVRFSISTSPFYAYTCCDDNIIRIWDLNGKKQAQLVCECKSHLNTVTSIDVNEDVLISCSRDKTISIWDVYKGTLLKTYLAYEQIESIHLLNSIEQLHLGIEIPSDYSLCFMTGGEYGYLRVFQGIYQSKENTYQIKELMKSTNDNELYYSTPQQESNDEKVSTLPNLYSIKHLFVYFDEVQDKISTFAITNDNMIKQYHMNHQSLPYIGSIVGYNDDIIDICYIGQDMNHVAVVSNVNYIRILDLTTFSSTFLYGHTSTVLAVKCSKNGQYLFSTSKDKTIKIWHVPTLTCLCTCTGHIQDIMNIAIEQKENAVPKTFLKKLFMEAMTEKEKLYQSTKTEQEIEKEVNEIVNNPESQILPRFFVTVSEDKTLKYWSIQDCIHGYIHGAEKTVKAHDKSINTVTIAPNDRLCATASQDKTIKLWSLPELNELATYSGHRRGVWDIHFSPINSILLSCSVDGCFRLWNVKENICIKSVEGADTSLLRCCFVKRGEQILTCDSTGVVRLYNTFTTELVNTFEGHKDKIWTIAVSPADQMVTDSLSSTTSLPGVFITGGSDGEIHIWEDKTQEERNKEIERKEEEYQKQQELRICMYKKQWKRAIQLCFELNAPQSLRKIIETVSTVTVDADGHETKEDVNELFVPVVKELTDEQRILLFHYIRDWNSIGRTSYVAHILLEVALKVYTQSDLETIPEIKEILNAISSYTNRHYQRINRLLQSSYLIDYCLSNMNNLNPNMSYYSNLATERNNKRVLENEEEMKKIRV